MPIPKGTKGIKGYTKELALRWIILIKLSCSPHKNQFLHKFPSHKIINNWIHYPHSIIYIKKYSIHDSHSLTSFATAASTSNSTSSSNLKGNPFQQTHLDSQATIIKPIEKKPRSIFMFIIEIFMIIYNN